jgi:hypothetical protein
MRMNKLRTEDLRVLAAVCDDLNRQPDVILFARQKLDGESASDRRVIFRELQNRGMKISTIAALSQIVERSVKRLLRRHGEWIIRSSAAEAGRHEPRS